MKTYTLTDYSDFSKFDGGCVADFIFTVERNILTVKVEGDDSHDSPTPPATKDAAIKMLKDRLKELGDETKSVSAMIKEAESCHGYEAIPDDDREEDDCEDEEDYDDDGYDDDDDDDDYDDDDDNYSDD